MDAEEVNSKNNNKNMLTPNVGTAIVVPSLLRATEPPAPSSSAPSEISLDEPNISTNSEKIEFSTPPVNSFFLVSAPGKLNSAFCFPGATRFAVFDEQYVQLLDQQLCGWVDRVRSRVRETTCDGKSVISFFPTEIEEYSCVCELVAQTPATLHGKTDLGVLPWNPTTTSPLADQDKIELSKILQVDPASLSDDALHKITDMTVGSFVPLLRTNQWVTTTMKKEELPEKETKVHVDVLIRKGDTCHVITLETICSKSPKKWMVSAWKIGSESEGSALSTQQNWKQRDSLLSSAFEVSCLGVHVPYDMSAVVTLQSKIGFQEFFDAFFTDLCIPPEDFAKTRFPIWKAINEWNKFLHMSNTHEPFSQDSPQDSRGIEWRILSIKKTQSQAFSFKRTRTKNLEMMNNSMPVEPLQHLVQTKVDHGYLNSGSQIVVRHAYFHSWVPLCLDELSEGGSKLSNRIDDLKDLTNLIFNGFTSCIDRLHPIDSPSIRGAKCVLFQRNFSVANTDENLIDYVSIPSNTEFTWPHHLRNDFSNIQSNGSTGNTTICSVFSLGNINKKMSTLAKHISSPLRETCSWFLVEVGKSVYVGFVHDPSLHLLSLSEERLFADLLIPVWMQETCFNDAQPIRHVIDNIDAVVTSLPITRCNKKFPMFSPCVVSELGKKTISPKIYSEIQKKLTLLCRGLSEKLYEGDLSSLLSELDDGLRANVTRLAIVTEERRKTTPGSAPIAADSTWVNHEVADVFFHPISGVSQRRVSYTWLETSCSASSNIFSSEKNEKNQFCSFVQEEAKKLSGALEGLPNLTNSVLHRSSRSVETLASAFQHTEVGHRSVLSVDDPAFKEFLDFELAPFFATAILAKCNDLTPSAQTIVGWCKQLRTRGIFSVDDLDKASKQDQKTLIRLLVGAGIPNPAAVAMFHKNDPPGNTFPCDTSLVFPSLLEAPIAKDIVVVPIRPKSSVPIIFPDSSSPYSFVQSGPLFTSVFSKDALAAMHQILGENAHYYEACGYLIATVKPSTAFFPEPEKFAHLSEAGFFKLMKTSPLLRNVSLSPLSINEPFLFSPSSGKYLTMSTSSGESVAFRRLQERHAFRSPTDFERSMLYRGESYVTPKLGTPIYKNGRFATFFMGNTAQTFFDYALRQAKFNIVSLQKILAHAL